MEYSIELTMNNLVETINRLRYDISTTDASPELEEELYEKMNRLIELEELHPEYTSANSPTLKGGGIINKGIHIREHVKKLHCPVNVIDDQDIVKYIQYVDSMYDDTPGARSYTTPKLRLSYYINGLTVALQYKDGVLINATTLGDGTKGEVVTDNAITVLNLPRVIKNNGLGVPESLVVVGEITMSKYMLERTNALLISEGSRPLSECGIAATGAMLQPDSGITASRNLLFYARDIVDISSLDYIGDITTQSDIMGYLEDIGFDVVKHVLSNGVDNLVVNEDVFHNLSDMVKHGGVILPYEYAGILISPELLDIKESMLINHKYPIQYKIPDSVVKQKITEISWRINIYGYIRPYGHLEGRVDPVKIYSNRELIRMNLVPGSIVKIINTNDGLSRIVDKLPDFTEVKHSYPTLIPIDCPFCKTELLTLPNQELKCLNIHCKELNMMRLKHFRDSMKLKLIADHILEYLYDNRIITNFSDFFDPKLEMKINSWNNGYISERLVKNIIKEIEDNKSIVMSHFIFAMGIECVRENTSKLLARYFPTIKSFMLLETGNLNNIPGITNIAADCIRKFVGDTTNQAMMASLSSNINVFDEYALMSNKLYNTSWVIIGEVSGVENIVQVINMYGGSVTRTITGSTTHVLLGTNPSQSKLTIANNSNITIVDKNEFFNMLG